VTEQAPDSISRFVGDDPAAARQLRRSLSILADEYAGQPLGRQIAEVLAGRRTMRDLADDPEFASMAHGGMRSFAEQWEAMTPEERSRLVREGEQAAQADT